MPNLNLSLLHSRKQQSVFACLSLMQFMIFGVAILSLLFLNGCALFSRTPAPQSKVQRTELLQEIKLPVRAPVELFLNEFEIPFLIAEHDEDAFAMMGYLHAHYRWIQLELLRYASQGRLSEQVGPFANQIDWGLRMIHFGKPAKEIWQSMPAESQKILSAYVVGINSYIRQYAMTDAKKASGETLSKQTRLRDLAVPPEFKLLNLKPAEFTEEDILTMGRLVAVDVSWFLTFSYLSLNRELEDKGAEEEGRKIWQRILSRGQESEASFGGVSSSRTFREPQKLFSDLIGLNGAKEFSRKAQVKETKLSRAEELVLQMLSGLLKTGSNSFVVSAKKSKTGSAMIANDPHLGVTLPNVWFVMGMKSPSFHMVGLTIPGTPFVALGRNPHLAWGGTNMRALTTDLYDVTDLPRDQFVEREELLKTRFWKDKTVKIRTTRFGPVVTDLPIFKDQSKRAISLKWVGQEPSDEITAFLNANRSKNINEFHKSFKTYGVSAQNFLVADQKGEIGHVLAARIPKRPVSKRADFVLKASDIKDHWQGFASATELPFGRNPREGFLASANNLPTKADPDIGLIFSTNNRIRRLNELLSGQSKISLEDLKRLQLDSYSIASRDLLQTLSPLLEKALEVKKTASRSLKKSEIEALDWAKSELSNWDFQYQPAQFGPTLFTQLVSIVGEVFYLETSGENWVNSQLNQAYFQENLNDDLKQALQKNESKVLALVEQTLPRVLKAWSEAKAKNWTWGQFHQLYLGSPLLNVPIIGSRFLAGVHQAAGGVETINKANHSWSSKPVRVQYGAQSRHVSDLSDLDQNYFVLLGGQDGYLGSENYVSQVDRFLQGELIQVPLKIESVRSSFKGKVMISPQE